MADTGFTRPTLPELIEQVRADLLARLGLDELLRRADGEVQARVAAMVSARSQRSSEASGSLRTAVSWAERADSAALSPGAAWPRVLWSEPIDMGLDEPPSCWSLPRLLLQFGEWTPGRCCDRAFCVSDWLLPQS